MTSANLSQSECIRVVAIVCGLNGLLHETRASPRNYAFWIGNCILIRAIYCNEEAHGFTEGGWNAAQIVLTPLAFKILKPKEESHPLDGKREALS
jgi:hypothetical protein